MTLEMSSMPKMSEITKKRGRPEVNSVPLTLRLPPDLIEALDEWRAEQPVPPNRADVLRIALVDWLRDKGYLK